MNHEEATRYLDSLGDTVPDRRPPIGDLVHAGKSAQRHRSRRTAGLVAAVAVLIGGGLWTTRQITPGSSDGVDGNIATAPTSQSLPDEPGLTSSPPLPGESAVANGPCPPLPPTTQDVDPATVPAPDDATGLTMNDSKTVAAWFEPASGPLPFLVAYDLVAGKELAREDLGPREDLRSSSLRMDDEALYYQSSADARVWLRYRWDTDGYPLVYVTCR